MTTEPALPDFFEFLRFGSVSTDPAYRDQVSGCAEWLRQRLERAGLTTQQQETAGNPVLVARGPYRAGRPTVLIYGHYDVQPVDPIELWHRAPFSPGLEDGMITARGASDNKGQIFAHLLGVEETLRATGDLPVNVIFLIEGEEEIGSPSLPAWIESQRAELACDVVVISDSAMIAPGRPTLTYGLRGLAALEVVVTGPDRDLHSGMFGGAVENPAAVLARLLASLHGPDLAVTIDGFYDGVQPITAWERRTWADLPLDEATLRRMSGAPRLRGEAGYTPLERLWARPTAEINGLTAGYQGEGTKTVLPSRAQAKLTFRLVPGQEPDAILRQAARHLRALAPDSVRLDLTSGHTALPYLVDPQTGYGLAAQRALGRLQPGIAPALIREGGSIPIVTVFKQLLGADTLLLGLCLPDCQAHSPNETFPVAHLDLGRRLNRELLVELGKGCLSSPLGTGH